MFTKLAERRVVDVVITMSEEEAIAIREWFNAHPVHITNKELDLLYNQLCDLRIK